ncbi:MAG: 4Fe-4S dicluster domain-containing protein [Acidobacteriota bacterium]
MSQTSSSTLAHIRTAGLVLFLIGFAVFIVALTLAHYEISDATFTALDERGTVQDGHRDALYNELRGLSGERFDSVLAFLAQVDGALDRTEATIGYGIGDYYRGEYKTAIAHAAAQGLLPSNVTLFFWLSLGLMIIGGLAAFLPRLGLESPGIKNDGTFFSGIQTKGFAGMALGGVLIGFYVLLYFYPAYITNWIRLADPVSELLRNQPADRWFFYGLLYTIAVLVMGVRMAMQYRHSRYQLVRTGSVMFFQLGFAFLIPAIMVLLNKPNLAYDLKNAWPLDYSLFYDYRIEGYTGSGVLGWLMLVWGVALAFLVVPLFAFFFGKRWYCSWVCGCGGLAETLGDPFRHLSDKRVKAWHAERWIVHGVLVFAVVMTGIVLYSFFTGEQGAVLGAEPWKWRQWYGFGIGSIFAGVVGTGFYPLMGNRVWCRFGCPLAAILGLVQRFKSRFRITTNGGQCISCGNCSTYCEMGIDVRWYAQRGQDVVRASCVGCGICSQVCPRGVLRLEQGDATRRMDEVSFVDLAKGKVEIG